MASKCAFFSKVIVLNILRLTAFILYYISAFDNATTLLNSSDSIFEKSDYELNRKCTNKDDDFMTGQNKNFSFATFIISFILNVAVFSINSVGYYKWYKSDGESPKYFSTSLIFAFFSIIFWVPGNFSARINYSESCTIIEGIIVHFFNIHGYRFIIASFTLTLIALFTLFFMGLLGLTSAAPLIGFLMLYSVLYYILSLIMIVWCTWAFQIPWIIIFIVEFIIGFLIIIGWTKAHEIKEKAPKFFLFIVIFY